MGEAGMRVVPILAAGLLAGCAMPTTSSVDVDTCRMDPADRAWIERSLAHWREAETGSLGLPEGELPDVTAMDAACSYDFPKGRFDRMSVRAHVGGMAVIGDQKLPIGPISFADASGGFFMSLPSVWRAAGVESELGLEPLMEGVLLHEIMHTRQVALASAALKKLALPSPDELNDDYVQSVFKDDAAYVAAYEAERDMLFAAAAAADVGEARRLASRALDMMRARKARWFQGDRAHFRYLDEIFLTMEGMGQWLVYRHFTRTRGIEPALALTETRRGGRQWTQDEGLALVLVVDRLLPNWQQRAFREPDWRAENLLAAAVAPQH